MTCAVRFNGQYGEYELTPARDRLLKVYLRLHDSSPSGGGFPRNHYWQKIEVLEQRWVMEDQGMTPEEINADLQRDVEDTLAMLARHSLSALHLEGSRKLLLWTYGLDTSMPETWMVLGAVQEYVDRQAALLSGSVPTPAAFTETRLLQFHCGTVS